jgi:hypothetical protein
MNQKVVYILVEDGLEMRLNISIKKLFRSRLKRQLRSDQIINQKIVKS